VSAPEDALGQLYASDHLPAMGSSQHARRQVDKWSVVVSTTLAAAVTAAAARGLLLWLL
jgi:hypothetical protein